MALICRTCLLENEGNEIESIFTEKLVDSECATLSEMVSLCTGVEISKHDKFSDFICNQCVNEVIIAFKYRKKCWQSQKILLELWAQDHEFVGTYRFGRENELIIDDNSENSIDVSFTPEIETVYVTETTEHTNSEIISLDITATTANPKNDMRSVIPKMHLDLIQYMKISEEDSAEGRRNVCILCSTAYKNIGHLRSHLGKVHKIASIAQFKCSTCGKTFSSSHILKMHIKIHTKNTITVICHYCGKKFDQAMLLEIHLRRHRGEKSFMCDQCDFRAFTSSELAMHKRSHTGEKPFKCHLCPAAYKTSSHRANHIRSHSDERPYKCNICSTSYKTRNTYRSHMDLHDPSKSVTCEKCSRTFNSRKNLRVHMAQHGEKQFKCTVCNKAAFYLKSGLQHHMKIYHRTEHGFSLKQFKEVTNIKLSQADLSNA